MTAYHHSPLRRTAAAAAAAVATVALAACGGGEDRAGGHANHDGNASPSASASAPGEEHNAADVTFARNMVPHHRQAVEMAGLAAARASSAEVRSLAEEIRKAQEPEIRTLSSWLRSWGEEVPDGAHGGHAGHGAAGMMSEGEMERLAESSGKAFDTAFLELMIKHHRGAVAMAETEKSRGSYDPAKEMADAVIATQTAEIERMGKLLGR